MDDPIGRESATGCEELRSEIARLNKVVQALMDRAERSTNSAGTDFARFQTTVVLEDQVRLRTDELTSSLQDNEMITRALRESEAQFRGLAEQSLAGVGIVDAERFVYANAVVCKMSGRSAEELIRMHPLDIVLGADRPRIGTHLRRALSGEEEPCLLEFRGVRPDGSVIDVELSDSRVEIGGKFVLIFLMTDVTARKRAESQVQALQDRLEQQVIHDPLTGLYNRRYLDESLDRELARALRDGGSVSVVMGDIDHFKRVNDEYGHLAGDAVLRTVGGLVKRSCRKSDIAFRYGGEEFLVVFPGMTQTDAHARAEHLRKSVQGSVIRYGAVEIPLTMSFGVASFPQSGTTVEEIVAAADHALYAAKDAGRNRVEVAGG